MSKHQLSLVYEDGSAVKLDDVRGRVVRSSRRDSARVMLLPADDVPGEVITVQSAAAECDLNVILQRYIRGAAMPEVVPGQFVDVSEVGDYADVQNRLVEFEGIFMRLTPGLREYFGNSPAVFADFVVAGEANREEGERIGLYEPRKSEDAPPPPTPPDA